jgi:hypothetical protein
MKLIIAVGWAVNHQGRHLQWKATVFSSAECQLVGEVCHRLRVHTDCALATAVETVSMV